MPLCGVVGPPSGADAPAQARTCALARSQPVRTAERSVGSQAKPSGGGWCGMMEDEDDVEEINQEELAAFWETVREGDKGGLEAMLVGD